MQNRFHVRAPRRFLFKLTGVAIMLLLVLVLVPAAFAQDDGGDPVPDDCAKCHVDEYAQWDRSEHATAFTSSSFIEARTRAGDPTYCRSCHATGYDPTTGEVSYEGVSCVSCHVEDGEGHYAINESAELCGDCHTGSHAPDYDEWLTSEHATMNIDCVDCHQSHHTDLRMENPTELCSTCHRDEFDSSVHGVEGMACHDCHMAQGEEVIDPLSGRKNSAGHTFAIPADVCANCHGMTHTLQIDGTSDEQVEEAMAELEVMVDELETKATNNLNLGLTGGGIGGLVLGVAIPWLLLGRRNKEENEHVSDDEEK